MFPKKWVIEFAHGIECLHEHIGMLDFVGQNMSQRFLRALIFTRYNQRFVGLVGFGSDAGAAQQTEAAIGVVVLNQMLAAGRPDSAPRTRVIV
jgi:hypothetical protein